MVWLAVLCAIASAAFLAFGTQRQSSAVQADTGGLDVNSRGIVRLLTNPRWLFGLALMGVGMLLNVAALTMAPLTVVQPLGAIALVMTTIINSRDQGISINRATWISIIVCMTGSVAFVLLAVNATHEAKLTPQAEWTVVGLLAVVVVFFGGIAFARRRRPHGAFFYIVGAGVLFGFTAVLVRTIAVALTHFDRGVPFWLQVPWLPLLAIVIAGLMGQYFNQNAYSSGPPELVIAGLTVIDPMVGVAIGIVILGELRPDVHPVVGLSMAGAAIVAIVGVVALSRHHPDVLARKEKRSKE
jgi:drug/metabolite transporter (DMT)-like permease